MMNRPIVELEPGWAVMQKGIDKLTGILEKNETASFTAEEYMSQYTTIYNMCTQRAPHEYSEQLYDRYKNAFITYLSGKVNPRIEQQQSGPHVLKELQDAWKNQEVMVRWLSRFFNYLDRYYVGRHNLPNLEMVALMAFRDQVYAPSHERAKDALLEQIAKERDHEQVDHERIKSVINVFIAVSINNLDKYRDDFEVHLIDAVREHYKAKSAEWIQSDSCSEYLSKAEASITAETERGKAYLHKDSVTPVVKATQEELLEKPQTNLIEKDSGCSAMLRDNKTEDLTRLFKLYHACSARAIDPIADIFRKHIEAEGMSLVKQASDTLSGDVSRKDAQAAETKFVQSVIELQDKYVLVVKNCFQAHSSMHKALKEAHEAFCNKAIGASSMAELLANYADVLLRGTEKKSEEECESQLDKIVRLLIYVNDRDVFGEFHRGKLSKRLLNTGHVENMETVFLQKLKQQCGASFTQKMEGMCADLTTARGKQEDFQKWLVANPDKKPPVDLEVKVLTTGFWPTYPPSELTLPVDMATCVSAFQQFYASSHNYRKLSWLHTLGQVTVKGHFGPGARDLVVAPYQAACLMLFNDTPELTVGDMMERLNLPEDDVVRVVSSLAHAKHHILKRKKDDGDDGAKDEKKEKKDKKEKRPDKSTTYYVHWGWSDKMRRVKVPMPVAENKRKVVEEVQKDRKYAIDAAIVRIMKSRKRLEHQQLVPQVLQQVVRMFTADAKLVKKRLEDLIDREYIERDENNNNVYKYLA